MRTPFVILVSLLGVYALSKDLPKVDAVLALYSDPQDNGVSGEDVFRKCAICHSLAPGLHRVGPSLHCIIGRKIASQPGYRDSTGKPDRLRDGSGTHLRQHPHALSRPHGHGC